MPEVLCVVCLLVDAPCPHPWEPVTLDALSFFPQCFLDELMFIDARCKKLEAYLRKTSPELPYENIPFGFYSRGLPVVKIIRQLCHQGLDDCTEGEPAVDTVMFSRVCLVMAVDKFCNPPVSLTIHSSY
ncbi:hypothetical protein TREES_T100014914 [Tupaia chinensis]|uniref:Uncharacterized protein n=1 Tax=Tupaia chinensis TaxID=246437 RepID=L9KY77_TUPCH|nr:hypothetical protein TREES_T100014914 [Tupaia chinensis]